MSDTGLEKFFELLDKIIEMPGTWQEKRDVVLSQATDFGVSDSVLSEFANWFATN